MVMLGDVEAVPMRRRRWEVSYKAVLHKACRQLAIGGSDAHVISVAREQEQRGREGEAVGRLQDAMQHVRWRGRCRGCWAYEGCRLAVYLYRQATLSLQRNPRDSAIW